MNRRVFLAAVGGGGIGVYATARYRWEQAVRDVHAEGDGQPDDHPLRYAVEVLGRATRSDPARIRVSVTNVTDTPREFFAGAHPPFGTFWGDEVDGDGQLVIVPDDREALTQRDRSIGDVVPRRPRVTTGCWQARGEIGTLDTEFGATLDPR